MRRLLFAFLLAVLAVPAWAQQTYVPRYDVFAGFSYLHTPTVDLNQPGFDTQAGVNVRRWLSLGGDFSMFSGDGNIHLNQTVFGPTFLPLTGGVNLGIPFGATTYTFAAGPQIVIRRWKPITPFIRPFIGGIHEHATLKPDPALLPLLAIVPGLSLDQSDTALFVGLGGGTDVNITPHLSLRMSVDWANTKLFGNLLNTRRNALRFSVGPSFHWGTLK